MTAFATLPQNTSFVNGSVLACHVVLHTVSDKSGISLADLKGHCRKREWAWTRQLAMHLMRRYCPGVSHKKIGKLVGGRDHTTVVFACRAIPGRLVPKDNETVMSKSCNIWRGYYLECNRLRRIHAEVLEELGLE